MTGASSSEFFVVVRALSAAHLTPDDVFAARHEDCLCVVATEFTGPDPSRLWPVSLQATVRGSAANLTEAQHRFSGLGGSMFGLISLAANAAHSDPGIVVAHSASTSAADPGEWIGYESTPATAHFPPSVKTIRAELVGRLLEAGGNYPSAGYHGRATGLYCEVLKHWKPETTLLAAEYLWLATEALSRGIVEAEAARKGMTPNNLARKGKVDALYARAREEMFAGDEAALKALEEASNGFEHSFMPLPEVRALTEPFLAPAARRVRHALISVVGLSPDDEAALLAPEFDTPWPLLPPMHFMRGELLVSDPSLGAVPVEEPIEVAWEEMGPAQIEGTPEGKFNYTRTKAMKLVRGLPHGVQLGKFRSGVRLQGGEDYTVSDVVVKRASDVPDPHNDAP